MKSYPRKSFLGKVWYFIWEDDSWLSWVVDIILAFLIVKFLLYPGLGLIIGTSHPVVAVVSGSMEHQGYSFQDWWAINRDDYKEFGIEKSEFFEYKFRNGFDKGDLMVLVGADEIDRGDVIVFKEPGGKPIIHRVIVSEERDGELFIQTKGDNNKNSDPAETGIPLDNVVGKAKYRIPYLGWFKVLFMELLGKA